MKTTWTCYARPAATGRTCWHVNAEGIKRRGLFGEPVISCEHCGITKHAGDLRKERGDVDKQRTGATP